ncbi:MAG: hypothetical protein K1X53_03355 [Candidatus Sumerlaeaceae bacterium]|nr:hypothetical protein [Candidatus Sumerlaeaceae bacterium]
MGKQDEADFEDDDHGPEEEAGLTIADADKIAADLLALLERAKTTKPEKLADELQDLAHEIQRADTQEVAVYLQEKVLPVLLQAYDEIALKAKKETDLVLFIQKMFAWLEFKPGLDRLPELYRNPAFKDGYLWTVVFGSMSHGPHPHAADVARALSGHFPAGFAAVAYLDFANELAHHNVITEHPFDNPEGVKLLRKWLTKARDGEESYGVSSAMALAFSNQPDRDELLKVARDHSSPSVQIEAAWAEAHLGRENGFKYLVAKCTDWSFSAQAAAYLKMLGREDLIPAEALTEESQAIGHMVSWLCHPAEYGQPPADIELLESRTIYWPPTEDTRTLHVLRFCMEEGTEKKDYDYGLVGSRTFSLFGDYGDVNGPDDVLALHCSWEMDGEADLEKGRELLGRAG